MRPSLTQAASATDSPIDDQRLTDEAYWDIGYSQKRETKSWPKLLGEKFLSRSAMQFFADGGFGEHLLVETMIKHGFPRRSDWKMLEIGSAPGKRLVFWQRQFGYQPFGVEYAARGAALNRSTFAAAGIDPENLLQDDLFDENFQTAHAAAFHVVSSFGLIEHFADPADAIAKHVNLLVSGGHLVVAIPNLRGINLSLTRFFHPEVIPHHNLDIMTRSAFRKLFTSLNLQELYCGYFGKPSLGLQNTRPGSWKGPLLTLGRAVEAPLELWRWKRMRNESIASRWASPYLLFLGRKR